MPTLTIQLPGQPPVFHVLRDETITIGRLKSNTIVIEDNSISLMHAKITRKDGQFYLKDLNSTNGTIVNGQPIGEVRLRDQDKVRFADITTQFLAEGDSAMTATSVTAPAAAISIPVAQPSPQPVAAVSAGQPAIHRATPAPAPPAPAAKATNPPNPNPKPERKPSTSRRALLVAAAVVLVALPGIGFVVWKSVNADRQGSAENVAALVPKAKKDVADSPAKQVPPAKPAVEAKAPEIADTPATPSLNITELVSSLRSKDATERRQAASSLHGAGAEAKDAIPALKDALKDSDTEVQMWAALALVNTQTYDKAIIPILLRALKNENAVLRQVACLSLGLIPYEAGDKQVVLPALTDAANKDADEEVRKAATAALNIVGAESNPQSAAK
jgi:pSer/pThr/pTyr-binding forkhead associated (FHA) protein